MTETPTSTRDGVLERSAEGGVIRFERRLPYTIEQVWDAITNPARLADWWLPFDADVTVELCEGGQITFTGREEPVTMTCTILRLEPPVLLEHTHADAGSRIRWQLESGPGGCILRLSHFVPDPAVAIDNCYVVGLHTSLDRLEPCLGGHPVAWDWDGFAATQARYARFGLAPAVSAP
jgi:uncharacterized protein YndB with AHSA1/START domain